MRNERPRVAEATLSTTWSLNSGPAKDGSVVPTTEDLTGAARGGSPIDAQILQQLRTRLRTTRSLEAVAGDLRHLGTLAAAAHRGAAAGLPAGIRLALTTSTAADGRGGDQSEDAA